MSEYAPGTFHFAEQIVDTSVQDARRQVRSARLGRQARAGGEKGRRFYSSALVALGCRLTTWGEGLQDRYGAEGSASVSQSARA
jgi:hypothetical protein